MHAMPDGPEGKQGASATCSSYGFYLNHLKPLSHPHSPFLNFLDE